MIYRLLYRFFDFFPSIKRILWKLWYTRFSKKIKDSKLKFMNYGYSSKELLINLPSSEEINRYPTQLYHYLATQTCLKNQDVLEIGSGRGGGAFYIATIFQPRKMVGIDISPSAIQLCNKLYNLENLEFCTGDAQKLAFEDNSFDVVINVESSHCYPDMSLFLKEVKRVLKPEGYFLFTDLRRTHLLEDMFLKFEKLNFKLQDKEDITENILDALNLMTEDRKNMIAENYPSFLHNIFESFAAVKGSKMYNSFSERYFSYVRATFKVEK